MGVRIPDNAAATTDPTLRFRLDPGEPGVLRSAPASQSTLRVAEQEGRNTRRLEAAARSEGRVVVRSVRQFTRADAGSFTATVAGRTTVESVEPRPTPVEAAQAIADARPAAADAPEPPTPPDIPDGGGGGALGFQGVGGPGLFNGGFRFASSDPPQAERNLIAQQAVVERALVEQAGAVIDPTNPEAAAAARQQLADLRNQAQQIEQDINRIRLARLQQGTEAVVRRFLGAVAAQADDARAMAGAAAGAGTDDDDRPDQAFLNLIA